MTGFSLPSRHSSAHSIVDAKATADALGIHYQEIPIESLHRGSEDLLQEWLPAGAPIANENIQARLRGLIIMAYANAYGAMAIATGNKSELAQGYCTLRYGGRMRHWVTSTKWRSMLCENFNARHGKEVVTNRH